MLITFFINGKTTTVFQVQRRTDVRKVNCFVVKLKILRSLLIQQH